MTMASVVDTLLNITVFAFIGVLVWLYVSEAPIDTEPKERRTGGEGERR